MARKATMQLSSALKRLIPTLDGNMYAMGDAVFEETEVSAGETVVALANLVNKLKPGQRLFWAPVDGMYFFVAARDEAAALAKVRRLARDDGR